MKKLNLLLIIIASLCGVVCSIKLIINGDIYEILISLSIIPVMLVPFIVRKLFKLNLTPTLECIYLVFTFFAHFLGSILNFYDTVNHYDKLIHFSSGIAVSFLALYLLINFKKYNSKKVLFNVLFIISFVLMIAAFWEFFEYSVDIVFKKDAQKVLETGVDDTMGDMIAAFVGAILFNIIYAYEEKTNKNILIKKYIKDVKNK